MERNFPFSTFFFKKKKKIFSIIAGNEKRKKKDWIIFSRNGLKREIIKCIVLFCSHVHVRVSISWQHEEFFLLLWERSISTGFVFVKDFFIYMYFDQDFFLFSFGHCSIKFEIYNCRNNQNKGNKSTNGCNNNNNVFLYSAFYTILRYTEIHMFERV